MRVDEIQGVRRELTNEEVSRLRFAPKTFELDEINRECRIGTNWAEVHSYDGLLLRDLEVCISDWSDMEKKGIKDRSPTRLEDSCCCLGCLGSIFGSFHTKNREFTIDEIDLSNMRLSCWDGIHVGKDGTVVFYIDYVGYQLRIRFRNAKCHAVADDCGAIDDYSEEDFPEDFGC